MEETLKTEEFTIKNPTTEVAVVDVQTNEETIEEVTTPEDDLVIVKTTTIEKIDEEKVGEIKNRVLAYFETGRSMIEDGYNIDCDKYNTLFAEQGIDFRFTKKTVTDL